ncbi:MAG: enoyl-CoA hydratase/isomerase family protein [Actinomycetota bacterium]
MVKDGILEVVIDWPAVRNALGPAEASELTARLAVAESEDCRCVVLRADGPVFCAGGNLRAVIALVGEGDDALRRGLYGAFQGLFRTLVLLPVPVIAAVAGPAIGLGLDLALACDVSFFRPGITVRQGWSSLNLIPATGGLYYACGRGGVQAAWKLLCAGGREIMTDEIVSWGLGQLAPDPDEAARQAARVLAQQPRDRLVASKRLIREGDLAAHLAAALEYQIGFLEDPHFHDAAARALQHQPT